MNILYDHQVFESQNIGGISRYFAELIKRAPSAQLSLKYSDNIYLQDTYFKRFNLLPKDYEYAKFLPGYNFRGKGRLFRYYNRLILRNKSNLAYSKKAIKKMDFEVFHPTYYNPYFLRYLKGKSFILTVHDMIHEIFSDYFPGDMTSQNKKILVDKATRINTNSETTKNDLLKFYPDVESKTKVVYHAFSSKIITEHKTKENYLLFTGGRGGYKNFDLFAKAVAPLLNKYDLRLICTGRPFDKKETDLLEYLDISNRVLCRLVSDEELIALYARAVAFVFPSLYEGFGIPVLEAFAAGCPAILSNTSSLPEVAGHGAVYFDPYSIDDMKTVIERVITSETLQNELIENGKEQVKKFSWEKCARETMNVYEMAVSSAK